MMLGLLAALLFQAADAPVAEPAPPPVLRDAVWMATPAMADVARARPKAPEVADVTGAAVIACKATAEGRLADCRVESERPPGMGFGAAALSLAPLYRMRPTGRDGAPVEGREVHLGIRLSPPPGPGVRLIAKPQWVSRPEGPTVSRYYPDRAMRMGVTGSTLVECTVNNEGLLDPCRVLDEYPSDYGFGEASLKLATLFQLGPQDEDGNLVRGGTVRIPFNWSVPH